MTQLLISVRSAEEAVVALRGGADWIDVKEPSRGSLGAADVVIQREVVAAIGRERPVSAALGELIEEPATESIAQGIAFAKVGLGQTANLVDWRNPWRKWAEGLPASAQPVAVAYADWEHAAAPSPHEVIDAAAGRAAVLLIDTWDKRRGGLFEVVAARTLDAWIAHACRNNFAIALAGSLSFADIDRALALEPDVIAVRGAACPHGRESGVDLDRVRRLAALVHRAAAVR